MRQAPGQFRREERHSTDWPVSSGHHAAEAHLKGFSCQMKQESMQIVEMAQATPLRRNAVHRPEKRG
ncbi:MAG: hypothetical protein I4O49_22815 [Janthinobacterium lividum]|nr:hypothetical protein [Janthinobacterium lividum]